MPKVLAFATGIVAFAEGFKRVLMANVPHASTLTLGSGRKIVIPGHTPYIRVAHSQIDYITPPENSTVRHVWEAPPMKGVVTNKRNAIDTRLLFLDHHEIVLPQSDDKHMPNLTPINSAGVPIPSDRPSLNWVATMNELGAATSKIKTEYLDNRNPGDAVAAFMRIPSGAVTTTVVPSYKFHGVKTNEPGMYGSLDRSLAQMIGSEFEVPDGPVELLCRHYTDPNKNFTIRFKPDEDPIWILVGMSSLEDLLQLSTVHPGFGEPDYHFRLIYQLADGATDDQAVVLPQAEASGPGKEVGFPRCVPASFGG